MDSQVFVVDAAGREPQVRDILPQLAAWWERGLPVGLGTVVQTWHSAPRPAGGAMAVGPDGSVIGSVSGGCVEGAVHELATGVVADGAPVLQRYGVSDDDAFAVGLTCGGILDVYVERVDRASFPELGEVAADVAAGRPVAVATVIEHPDPEVLGRRVVVRPEGAEVPVSGSTGRPRLDHSLVDDARGLLSSGRTATLTLGPDGERLDTGTRAFVLSYLPPPRLVVVGAIDFAAALAEAGAFLGYRVTVCDARPLFATEARFPQADEVVVDWPHRYLAAEAAAGRLDARTAVAVLTHDPKFDVPALELLLRLPELGYVGAMGSRRTHEDRMERLREAGLTDDQLGRLSSPIGLNLGARTPQETAVSIVAEMIALTWGGDGRRLSQTEGAIHAS